MPSHPPAALLTRRAYPAPGRWGSRSVMAPHRGQFTTGGCSHGLTFPSRSSHCAGSRGCSRLLVLVPRAAPLGSAGAALHALAPGAARVVRLAALAHRPAPLAATTEVQPAPRTDQRCGPGRRCPGNLSAIAARGTLCPALDAGLSARSDERAHTQRLADHACRALAPGGRLALA